MARIDLDELVEHWTLIDGERELVAGKRGPTRLGFALLLKFYTRHGRFPRGRGRACRTRRSSSSPARSRCPASSWGCTSGLAARSSTTARRSAATSASGSAPSRMPDKLTGWLAEQRLRARNVVRSVVREELLAPLPR